ncbi:hypothetical protein [Roseivivax isoporae]|uniref:Uncharacterized protein n=1 Tax=Roseivivax isoporae LMG 25204 TaxID=1449351 RepID=X7F7F4_9RHOB|nr:hypothetical protein [Roseivivax isoporae]ETX28862.1 hypothetical protein RISW2_03905 [Roseivivax isoporae LMG 25204]
MPVGYTTFGTPEARTIGVRDPILVGLGDATYDFGVTANKSFLWSFLDGDPTNNGTWASLPQLLAFSPIARGDKVLTDFDPDAHVLRFDLMGSYFGKTCLQIDSSEEFTDFLALVDAAGAAKGHGQSYVTVHGNDIVVRIDADKSGLGDLRLTFDDLADGVDLSGLLKVVDFDDFALPDGGEASLLELNGGSNCYAGFEWSQLGIFNPAGDAQIGYDPTSDPNVGFIGEKDGTDQPGYDGYGAEAGSPLEIYSADAFNFVSAAFNAVNVDASAVERVITVTAYADGIAEAVGQISFVADNVGAQEIIAFGSQLDGERFENINRLVIDADGYFGIDDLTYI